MLLVDCRYVAGPAGPGSMITFVTERVTESSMKKANCTKSWPSFTFLPSQWKTNLSKKSQWNRSWCTAGVRSASSFLAFLGSHPPRWLKDMSEKFLQTIPSILSLCVTKALMKIYSVAGQAGSSAEVSWWEVKSMWRPRDGPSMHDTNEIPFWRRRSVRLSQLPVVWLSLSPSDCLPALMLAQVSPPFPHEMPCAHACTHWSGPPDSHYPGATSVPPGRCLLRTHLSPGSQRSATGSTLNLSRNHGTHSSWNVIWQINQCQFD